MSHDNEPSNSNHEDLNCDPDNGMLMVTPIAEIDKLIENFQKSVEIKHFGVQPYTQPLVGLHVGGIGHIMNDVASALYGVYDTHRDEINNFVGNTLISGVKAYKEIILPLSELSSTQTGRQLSAIDMVRAGAHIYRHVSIREHAFDVPIESPTGHGYEIIEDNPISENEIYPERKVIVEDLNSETESDLCDGSSHVVFKLNSNLNTSTEPTTKPPEPTTKPRKPRKTRNNRRNNSCSTQQPPQPARSQRSDTNTRRRPMTTTDDFDERDIPDFVRKSPGFQRDLQKLSGNAVPPTDPGMFNGIFTIMNMAKSTSLKDRR